ncbi:MAG: hypothetical protein ACLSG5_14880 [Oscillospiraceae bacterium]
MEKGRLETPTGLFMPVEIESRTATTATNCSAPTAFPLQPSTARTAQASQPVMDAMLDAR